jgi:hypothetical protein
LRQLVVAAATALLVATSSAFAFPGKRTPFIPAQGSTSPANGDLNPYGLAVVPDLVAPGGMIHRGQLLVSNFNNSAMAGNVQGEGRTIVIIDPDTAQQTGLFYQGTHNIGVTNALAPDGNFVTANADPAAHVDPAQPSELVEFTPEGQFVRQYSIDPNNGSAFAILNVRRKHANSFAYVDDFSSTLTILELTPF